MAKPVLLNNITHQHLRVRTGYGAAFGDDQMAAPIVAAEFRQVQAHYPIVFRATDSGFEALALFGLAAGENLFLTDADANAEGGWDADYVPLAVRRQPFLIGVSGQELTVHVDQDSARLRCGPAEGQAVFLEEGSPAPYLEEINSMLFTLHEGMLAMADFIAALQAHALLEPFTFEVELADGSERRLGGLYTINEEVLAALDATALDRLHRAGYLLPIYMVVASLSNFRALIDRNNRG
ncbi:peptidase [Duganella sp. Leaf126]|uniref:SapC family protein n=1 Tax=Duganella sp. Leaf126 TaxID=1736266 RepID=UPI0006F2DC58|nr:SapC family protein [Duganella sp. Leaf126]KQQ47677.1 peptidase [Duganella sp. Leaf126]